MSKSSPMIRDDSALASLYHDPASSSPVSAGCYRSWIGTLYFLVTGNQRILHLTFSKAFHDRAFRQLAGLWPKARMRRNAIMGPRLAGLIETMLGSPRPRSIPIESPFLTAGTSFQQAVWRTISEIPSGKTLTYKAIADRLDRPGACRAVGQACGANPLVLLIPCHRVVGVRSIGGFAGTISIKQKLLAMEQQANGFPPH